MFPTNSGAPTSPRLRHQACLQAPQGAPGHRPPAKVRTPSARPTRRVGPPMAAHAQLPARPWAAELSAAWEKQPDPARPLAPGRGPAGISQHRRRAGDLPRPAPPRLAPQAQKEAASAQHPRPPPGGSRHAAHSEAGADQEVMETGPSGCGGGLVGQAQNVQRRHDCLAGMRGCTQPSVQGDQDPSRCGGCRDNLSSARRPAPQRRRRCRGRRWSRWAADETVMFYSSLRCSP